MKRDAQKALLAAAGRYIRRQFSQFEPRLKALETRPAPQDGKSVTLDDLRPLIAEYVNALPRPQDGKSVTVDDVRPLIEECARAIPAPKDGTSVTLDDVRPMVDEFLRGLPVPQDGKSVTLEDVRPYLDAEIAQWALSFERRAQDILHRAVERIEKPKDGLPGKDGVSYDEFHVEQIDDRTVRETWSKGGVIVKTFDRKVRAPIYREIYRQGERYERDDMVTFGGSVWCALRDTDSKPGTDDSWRLAVKAGRDAVRRDGQ